MMKQRVILVVVVVLLLLTTVALAQPERQYTVECGTISGEGYHLTSTSWQVSGMTSGGDYQLLHPAAPQLTGSGCCCTYLPLIAHSTP
jgi:hypothetical protein